MKNYTDKNADVIDSWIKEGWEWGRPISHDAFKKAQQGSWDVLLTPTKPVPKSWFLPFPQCNILGLASGGGQQMPIFTALGANCTVMDYSHKQLESEKMVADREGYTITTVRADMTQSFPFGAETFDLIFHPVANCYVETVLPIWHECFRVLKKGGVLLAGMDIGINYIFDDSESVLTHKLPYNPLTDDALLQKCLEKNEGIQFSHTIEEQLGGLLQAGFTLKNLYEDTNGSGKLHEYNVPSFVAVRATK